VIVICSPLLLVLCFFVPEPHIVGLVAVLWSFLAAGKFKLQFSFKLTMPMMHVLVLFYSYSKL